MAHAQGVRLRLDGRLDGEGWEGEGGIRRLRLDLRTAWWNTTFFCK